MNPLWHLRKYFMTLQVLLAENWLSWCGCIAPASKHYHFDRVKASILFWMRHMLWLDIPPCTLHMTIAPHPYNTFRYLLNTIPTQAVFFRPWTYLGPLPLHSLQLTFRLSCLTALLCFLVHFMTCFLAQWINGCLSTVPTSKHQTNQLTNADNAKCNPLPGLFTISSAIKQMSYFQRVWKK